MALAGTGTAVAVDFGPSESERKASLIGTFLRHFEWTNPSKTRKDLPIIVGVYGNDPIIDSLREILQSRPINGRSVMVRSVHTLQEVPACHVLIVGRGDAPRAREIIRESRREGVLTVGDSDRFHDAGGVIQFVKQGSSVRYTVDVRNARREGLKPSGYLIRNQATYQDALEKAADGPGNRRVAGELRP